MNAKKEKMQSIPCGARLTTNFLSWWLAGFIISWSAFIAQDLVVGVWWACWWFWVARIAFHAAKFGCRLFKEWRWVSTYRENVASHCRNWCWTSGGSVTEWWNDKFFGISSAAKWLNTTLRSFKLTSICCTTYPSKTSYKNASNFTGTPWAGSQFVVQINTKTKLGISIEVRSTR